MLFFSSSLPCAANHPLSLRHGCPLKHCVAAVPDPPFITQFPTSITVNSGQTATLRCIASGSPLPNFQWLKDGNDVAGNTGVTITTSNGDSNLTITNIQTSDAGTNECRAFNSEGRYTGSATITVTGE